MRRILLLSGFLILSGWNLGELSASEYKAQAVSVLDGSGKMHEHTLSSLLFFWSSVVSRPVGTNGIPDQIQIGDTITVEGRPLTVRHIVATYHDEDIIWQGKYIARKGDTQCMLVESLKNIPSYEPNVDRERLWVRIGKCKVLK